MSKHNNVKKDACPPVSVLVTTRNVGEYLHKCLSSVFLMSYRNFEVIVVDSNSSDNTLEIAKKFPVKLIRLKQPSIPNAYNTGIPAAKGKYIFVVNGDSTVSKEFLKAAINKMTYDQKIGIVSGERKQAISKNITTRLYQFRFERHDRLGRVNSVGGNYVFIKSTYLKNIHPVSENLVAGEEKFISQKFINAGFEIVRIAKVAMVHLDKSTSVLGYWKKHVWYSKGKVELLYHSGIIDIDFLVSLWFYTSCLISLRLGGYSVAVTAATLSLFFYRSARKYFEPNEAIKIASIEVVSTLLRSVVIVPFLLKKLTAVALERLMPSASTDATKIFTKRRSKQTNS